MDTKKILSIKDVDRLLEDLAEENKQGIYVCQSCRSEKMIIKVDTIQSLEFQISISDIKYKFKERLLDVLKEARDELW